MSLIGSAQSLVILVLGAAFLGLELWALIHAATQRADAFIAAGKLSKPKWVGITGLGAIFGFLTVFSPLNLFGLLGVVAAAVYLADVRPAVSAASGRGGGQNNGPYGPW